MTTDIETKLTTWNGEELQKFLDDHGWTPEQIAEGLGYRVSSVNRWLGTTDGPFAGGEQRTHELRYAIMGLMRDGDPIGPPRKGAPLAVTLYINTDDSMDVGAKRLARERRERGTGQRASVEFVHVEPSR